MIDVQHLTKYYGQFKALDDVSFSVHSGEVLGFLGPNGAGKTTTMKIITCFMPASSGTVTVDGFDIFANPLEVRQRIGYLPENNPLYPELSVSEYLRFVAEMHQIPNELQKKRLEHVLESCGLTEFYRFDIGKLSKGLKQRVGLAQAMIHDPKILILDEPTVGLDPNQIIEIRNLIKKIGQEKTIILCSHILSEVEATCNRMVIIDQGSIVGAGTVEELKAQTSKATLEEVFIHLTSI